MQHQIVHPWRDLSGYIDVRIREALYGFELAESFLRQGIHRNAAGRAFQAWKAALAAAAAARRGLLAGEFRGVVRTKERRRVEKVDLVIALMPTTLMKRIARLLSPEYGSVVVLLAELALDLHEFQYNGVDPTGTLSRYVDLKDVEGDVMMLTAEGRKFVEGLRER